MIIKLRFVSHDIKLEDLIKLKMIENNIKEIINFDELIQN